MDENRLKGELSSLPLGGLRYYDSVDSTNDDARAWALQSAPDLSLVVADEQTAGRGRGDRRWLTPSGSALAFSLILRPSAVDLEHTTRLSGLGAVAMAEACLKLGLHPAIKWPNDLLLQGRKVGGVLVESIWNGDALEASVLGIGMNVLSGSVPPEGEISYPATSIESVLGHPIERIGVLREVLHALIRWRANLAADQFIRAWEGLLAYRGKEVRLTSAGAEPISGILLGLENDGSVRLEIGHQIRIIQSGEIHLRGAKRGIG